MTTRTRRPVDDPLRQPMLINGELSDAAGRASMACLDPYTGQEWAVVPRVDEADVDAAVNAARHALHSGPWPTMTGDQRARLLWSLADAIEAAAGDLGWMETCDIGKTLGETTSQAVFASRVYRYYAGWCDKVRGRLLPMDVAGSTGYSVYEPRGVCALITAWNSPMQLLANKLPAALAAGNTVVIKPSELAPVSTLALGQLVQDVGFPPGVVNIICGGPPVGRALTGHPGVDMISVTGGLETGRSIARSAAETMRPAVMELGGKSPQIVFDDCDVDRAADAITAGIFGAAGQSCVAGSRLLVQRPIIGKIIDAIIDRARKIRIGDPLDPKTDLGPQANRHQHERVLGFLEATERAGVAPAVGGLEATRAIGGLFTAPTVYVEPPRDLPLCREEVFGPVLAVLGFDTEEEAVALANDSELGLAAGVHTTDLRRALRMTEVLDVGTVWVNTYRRPAATAPFGGEGLSGLGRERGWEGLLEFSRVKTVMIDHTADS